MTGFDSEYTDALDRNEGRLALAESVGRFFGDHANLSHTRSVVFDGDGTDGATRQRLNDEFGASRLHVPETFGGDGFGIEELAVLIAESARVLSPVPLLSYAGLATALAIALQEIADRRSLVTELATGDVSGTLALLEPGGTWACESVSMSAIPDREYAELTGTKVLVTDPSADIILVPIRLPTTVGRDGLMVAALKKDSAGVTTTTTKTLDPTRPLQTVEFQGARAELIAGPVAGVAEALERALDIGRALLAAEMVAGARQCLEMAISYAKVRRQFSRPIGSFQAVKHRCAEMLREIELSDALSSAALRALEIRAEDGPLLASCAKLQGSQTFLYAALESLHVFGGIGFTWEHDIHLFVRRAKFDDLFLGSAEFHRRRVAEQLGLTPKSLDAAEVMGRSAPSS